MWRVLILVCLGAPVLAESVVATRTIRAATVLGPEDITLVAADLPGALDDPALALGLEARVAIYAGRPVMMSDLGPPTLVGRNQIVPLIYVSASLAISTEGRALQRGAEGDVIKVLNLSSRSTILGQIGPDGAVYVRTEN
ncbi:MAG: flagella basal body P-ring formation protein FlgA [Rhodobacterales bacterium 32-66-7]|nr:MAG: flagella basal body P-ring formation protein FlgA [Rhodobacterales bacterium 12-65-15]OYX23304.1 MAG: flagella basal body P-ring formation protein FlgA [Rhodobacterales bacterium 32-66-7]OZA16810.1 MAG: flagella basal body P-ring formation protein FlgA [Rhodobacterales bacterium 17-64-5]